MKRIYLVRHGESEANVARSHGDHATPLTETGKEQAAFMAQRVMHLPIQKVIASSMVRAHLTAEIIAAPSNLPVITSDLFVESRGPSEFATAPYDDPKAIEAFTLIGENYGKPGFQLSDAETFDDHTKRAQAALQFLADQEEEHILVVTHGMFLRILAAHIVFGPTPSSHECQKFMRRLQVQNTGLTVFDYGTPDYIGRPIEFPWRLWIWNDHAHLAD